MTGLSAIHLNGLRAVEAVARCGSLLKAAEELGVSPSAVSQQIGRAEKQIGRALFERTREGLAPTEFGAHFAARLSAGFRELAQAVALADDGAANPLVVSVAPAFASRWLVPRLSRFYAKYPGFSLRIDADDAPRRLSSLRRRPRDPHGRRPLARRASRIAAGAGNLSSLCAVDRQAVEDDRRSRERMGDLRRKQPVHLGSLVRNGRRVAGRSTAGRSLHRPDALRRGGDRRSGRHARLAIARRRRAGRRPARRAVRRQRAAAASATISRRRRDVEPAPKVLAFKRWIVEEVAKTMAEFGVAQRRAQRMSSCVAVIQPL